MKEARRRAVQPPAVGPRRVASLPLLASSNMRNMWRICDGGRSRPSLRRKAQNSRYPSIPVWSESAESKRSCTPAREISRSMHSL